MKAFTKQALALLFGHASWILITLGLVVTLSISHFQHGSSPGYFSNAVCTWIAFLACSFISAAISLLIDCSLLGFLACIFSAIVLGMSFRPSFLSLLR